MSTSTASTQTYPATEEGLTAALAALGDTAEVVAERLLAGGHRGVRENGCACPTAVYLSAVIPDAWRVEVDLDLVRIWPVVDSQVRAQTTEAVNRFVGEFDSGEHEALAVELDGELDGDQ